MSNIKEEELDEKFPIPVVQFETPKTKTELVPVKIKAEDCSDNKNMRSEFDAPSLTLPQMIEKNKEVPGRDKVHAECEDDEEKLDDCGVVATILSLCIGSPSIDHVSCKFCPSYKFNPKYTFPDISHLARHTWNSHRIQASEMIIESSKLSNYLKTQISSSLGSYTCPLACSFSHANMTVLILKKHIMSHHRAGFVQVLNHLGLKHHLTILHHQNNLNLIEATHVQKKNAIVLPTEGQCFSSNTTGHRSKEKGNVVTKVKPNKDSTITPGVRVMAMENSVNSAPSRMCPICGYRHYLVAAVTRHMIDCHVNSDTLLDFCVHWSDFYFKCIYCQFKFTSIDGASSHIDQKHGLHASVIHREIKSLNVYLAKLKWRCGGSQLETKCKYPSPWGCKEEVWNLDCMHELKVHLQLAHQNTFQAILRLLGLSDYSNILNLKSLQNAKDAQKAEHPPTPIPSRTATPVSTDKFAVTECLLCGYVATKPGGLILHLHDAHISSTPDQFHMSRVWKANSYQCLYCTTSWKNISAASNHMNFVHTNLALCLQDESTELDAYLEGENWRCPASTNSDDQEKPFPWGCVHILQNLSLPALKVHLQLMHASEFKSILTKLELKEHLKLLELKYRANGSKIDLGSKEAEHSYNSATEPVLFKPVIHLNKRPRSTDDDVCRGHKLPRIIWTKRRMYYCHCKSLLGFVTLVHWAKHMKGHHVMWDLIVENCSKSEDHTCPTASRTGCPFIAECMEELQYHMYYDHLRFDSLKGMRITK